MGKFDNFVTVSVFFHSDFRVEILWALHSIFLSLRQIDMPNILT